jgi:hypothetical protein
MHVVFVITAVVRGVVHAYVSIIGVLCHIQAKMKRKSQGFFKGIFRTAHLLSLPPSLSLSLPLPPTLPLLLVSLFLPPLHAMKHPPKIQTDGLGEHGKLPQWCIMSLKF